LQQVYGQTAAIAIFPPGMLQQNPHRRSFHPETVLFRPGCVNLRVCLCGVPGVRLRATPWFWLVRRARPAGSLRCQLLQV